MVSNLGHNPSRNPLLQELEELGARVEAYRLARNITQAQLAEDANVSRSTLARLETTGGGTLETVLRVMRALGIQDRILLLVPPSISSPLDPLAGQRQRARPVKKDRPAARPRWGDEK